MLAVFGSGCLLPGGVHGAPIADPGGPISFRPGVGQTSAGVPAIDITRPNAAGTSYNRYQRFDVQAEGVVLNNSSRGGTTLLGGSVEANPNLAGGAPASVIVNEVVAPGAPSRLAGTLEVFGAPATVVVANPYGVSCSGCGTLNSQRFMLSTGTPVWLGSGGSPAPFAEASGLAFDVAGGELSIEGRGLEGTVGKVDLVAVGIHLDGPVRAHYLNPELAGITLLAGAGRVGEQDGRLDNIAPLPASPAPARAYAIDGTVFGAMSSSQIRIVSTEQGAGVRLAGPLLADSRGLVVTSAGDLTLGDLRARQSITLDAAGNLSIQGMTEAGGDLAAQAGGNLAVQGPATVVGKVGLAAGATLDVAAPVAAGGSVTLDADRVRLSAGVAAADTQIRARELTLGDGRGDFKVQGDLGLAVAGDLIAPGAVTVTGNTRLASGASVGFSGDVSVGGDFSVDAGIDIRAGGRVSVGGRATLRAVQSVDIVGEVSAGALDLAAGRAVLGGDVLVVGDARIGAGKIVLPRKLEAGGSLRLETAGDLLSDGRIAANGDLSLIAGGSMSLAESVAGGRVGLEARGGTLSVVSPLMAGGAASLSAQDGITTDAVYAGGSMRFVSSLGGIDIGGPLAGAGGLTMVAPGAIRLGGDTSLAGDLEVRSTEATVRFDGSLTVGGGATLRGARGLVLGGDSFFYGPLTLGSSDGLIAHKGLLHTNTDFILDTAGAFVSEGRLESRGQVSIRAASLLLDEASAGGVFANGDIRLAARESIRLGARGEIVSGAGVRIESPRFETAGAVLATGGEFDFSGGTLANSGVLAGQAVRVDGRLDNAAAGQVSADRVDVLGATVNRGEIGGRDITLSGGLDNAGSVVGERVGVEGGDLLNSGSLGGGVLRIDARRISNSGLIAADSTEIRGASLANSGVLYGGRVDLALGGGVVNGGVIESADRLTLSASTLDNLGSLRAGSAASLDLVQGLRNEQGTLSAADGLSIRSGASVINRGGLIVAGGDLDVSSAGDLDSDGLIATNGRLRLEAGQALKLARGGAGADAVLIAREGRAELGSEFVAGGNLLLDGRDGVSAAAVAAGGSLALRSARGDVSSGALVAKGPVSVEAAAMASLAGAVFSEADVSLTGQGVTVGGKVGSAGRLSADAGGGALALAAEVRADGDILLKGRQVSAAGVQGASRVEVQAGVGGIENTGMLIGNTKVEVVSAGRLQQAGLAASQGDVVLTAGQDAHLAGDLESGGRLELRAGGALVGDGAWRSAGAAEAQAGTSLTVARNVVAGSALKLTSGAGDLAIGGVLASNGTVILKSGADLLVAGLQGGLNTGAGVSVDAAGDVSTGAVLTGGDYRVSAGRDYRASGDTLVLGRLDLAAGRDVTQAGSVTVGREGVVQAGGALNQGDTRIFGAATLTSGGKQRYAGGLAAEGALAVQAGAGVEVAGTLLSPERVNIEAGAGALAIAGDLRSGGPLQVSADRTVSVGGEALGLADARLVSRQADVSLAGPVAVVGALSLAAAGDARIAADARVGSTLDARAETGSVVFSKTLEVHGAASFAVGQDLVFQGDARFHGPLSADTVGRRLESHGGLMVDEALHLDIAGDFISEGLLQSVGGIRIRAANIQANLTGSGGMVANGDIELSAREQGRLGVGGTVLSSTGSVLLSGRNFENAGEVLSGGGRFAFSGGSLTNLGRIAAGQGEVAGGLDNRGTLYSDSLTVSGYTVNGGTVAGSGLAFEGGLLNTGRIAGADVTASGLVSNAGEMTGDRVSLFGPDVQNYGLVSAGRLGIQTVQLGNLGTLSADSLDAYVAGTFTNAGRVAVSGDARITALGGFANQLTEASRCVTPAVCNPPPGNTPPRAPDPDKDFRFVQSPAVLAVGGSLSLSGGDVDNRGLIQAGRIDINIGSAAFNNTRSENDVLTDANFGSKTPTVNTGVIAAEDGIVISAGSFANTGGRVAAGGSLDVSVTGRLASVAGARDGLAPVMQALDVTLGGTEVVTEGLVQARRNLNVTARAGSVSNRATLVADDNLTVKAATLLDNAAGGALLATREVSLQAGKGINNAGLIYGNGAAAQRITLDAGSGAFSNAVSGTVLAESALEIRAAGYSNSGMVASRGDARLDAPSLVLRPASNPLVALGTLRLNVAGIAVGVGETWVSPALNTIWSGALVNTGNVLLGGNAYGTVENLATGSRTPAGEPNVLDGSYLLLGLPTLTNPYLVSYSDVGQRANFVVNGYFQGSLHNFASDARVAGQFAYIAESAPQTLVWANASGDMEVTHALSLPRLDATGGPSLITLKSPDAGTIKADVLSLSGVDLTVGAGVDSSAAREALAASRENRVQAAVTAGVTALVRGLGQGPLDAPGLHIMTPSATAGSGGAFATPGRPLEAIAESITRSVVSGAGPADLAHTDVSALEPPSGESGASVPRPWVNVGSALLQGAMGGGSASVISPDPTPSQTLPATEAARYGLTFPDWGSFSAPAGSLTANNLELVLSGNFTNRGRVEAGDQLLIKAEGRIDNFGASIKAGGALGLFGASLDNRNGLIEADRLALSVDGQLDNTRGQILIDKDAAIYAGGDLINDSGRIEAGSLSLSVAGDLFNRTLYAVDRNETTTRSHTDYDSVFGTTTTTHSDTTVAQRADQRAGIVARSGDLGLNVGKNLTSTGADLIAAGDLTGRVGGKIDIQALRIENSRTQIHAVTNERSYTLNNGETETTGLTASGSQVSTQIERDIQHQGTRLEAGGRLDLESGGSTVILGADIKSGSETSLVAGGHLIIGALQSSTHTESRVVTQIDGAAILPGLVNRNGEQLTLTHGDSAVGGSLDSGGETTLHAGGSLVLSGQRIQSKGDTRLVGDSVVLEGLSLNHSKITQDSFRNTIDLKTSSAQLATHIKSGGRIDIVSTGTPPEVRPSKESEPNPDAPPPPPAPGSISGTGAILEAKGPLTVAATGDVTLKAGYDSRQFAQRNKSGSSVVERWSEHAVGSTLSGSEVAVSGRNLSLEAIKVNAIDSAGTKGNVNIVAQENLALTAGTDKSFEHTVSVKKSGGLLRKKVTTTEHTEYSADAAASALTGHDINLKAGGNIDLHGTQFDAQGGTVLDAGGELSAYALQNVHTVQDTRKVSRDLLGLGNLVFGASFSLIGGSSKRTDSTSTETAVVTHLQSLDSLTLKSGGNTLLQGTQIQASDTHISVGQGDKASTEAELIIQGARNRVETVHTSSRKSAVWQSMSGHGETTETLTLVNIQSPVTIQAPKIVAQLPEGEFKTQLEKLSSQPGQEWLLQLADRPGVDWQRVALAHEKWDYQHSGLTAEAALAIAIVVAVMMPAGAGANLLNASGVAAGTVTAGTVTTTTILGAAANAGLVALTSQAVVSAINNKGDLGKILSDLGSEESVRSLATTMITAGMLNELAGRISFTNADGTLTKLSEIGAKSDFVAQLGKNAINNTVRALIDTSINGGDLADKIGRGLFLGAVDAAGASAANWVGDLDGFSNKVGHLIVGCAMGAAKSGDCASGAVGGLVGELAAEWYGGSRDPLNATEASKTVNIARLFGALVNTVIGGDAQVGADAAGNAAQNNFLNHAQVKQLNAQLAQCQGQASCISQTIDDARALDKRQHDLIGQTETIQGSRALVEGIQRPGATIDTSLCAGVSACVQYAAELPLINSRDYIYGTQDRLGELAQIKRIHAFETQIRQANPELSDEEVTRQAGARAGVYDAGRLGQLLGAASRGTGAGGGNAAEGVAAVEKRGSNANSFSTGADEAVFWSGKTDGIGGVDVACTIAKGCGGTTLEQLMKSRGITLPAWDAGNPTVVAAWESASRNFALGANGDVTAVIGGVLRPGSVWETVELPVLKSNPNVTSITVIDPATGLRTVIFKR